MEQLNNNKYYKGNVMTPLNWAIGITEIALVSGIIGINSLLIQIFCMVLVVAVLVFYGYVYLYFMKKSPEKLQTEEYNLRQQELTYQYTDTIVVPEDSSLSFTSSTSESSSFTAIDVEVESTN